MNVERAAPARAGSLPVISPRDESIRLLMLVYGAPGVGKTVLAGTAEDCPETAPVLFLDVEGGRMSISQRGRALDVLPMLDYTESMRQLSSHFQTANGQYTGGYQCVVVDSLTALADSAMASVLANPSRKGVPGQPDFEDWNAWTNRMKAVMRFFRDLPVHVLMTALESEAENGKIEPLFPGKKIHNVLPGYFNTVARMTVVPYPGPNGRTQYRRRLLLQADGQTMMRDRADRLGTLPREMDDPTVAKLMARMAEGKAQALTRQMEIEA